MAETSLSHDRRPKEGREILVFNASSGNDDQLVGVSTRISSIGPIACIVATCMKR
jgi:hypothetical protein